MVAVFCRCSPVTCCATERRRSTPAPKEEEKVNEEQWPLREVVFVEDVKNVPVGKVGAGVHIDPAETETTSIFSPLIYCLHFCNLLI